MKLTENSIGYRFTDSKYALLSMHEQEMIIPLEPDTASNIWKNIFGPDISHMSMLADNRDIEFSVLHRTFIDDDFELSSELSFNTMPISNHASITVFWSKSVAVITSWGLFKKYWSDFCYPDDDNVVMINFCEFIFFSDGNMINIEKKDFPNQ